MNLSFHLRLALLAMPSLFGGCIYTCHRTYPVKAAETSGRPMAWNAADKAFAFHHVTETHYRRTAVYPVGFRFFHGWMAPLEFIPRLPTLLLELPFSWEARTRYDVTVMDHTPQTEAVLLRPMPYYAQPIAARHGEGIARSFAHSMFGAYRRIFEKEIDFEKGDMALAAGADDSLATGLYRRTYERWLAEHVPVLAWQDRQGGENLLLRRPEGLDHYRDLRLVRTIKMDLPYDALFDTIDGENVYILFRGWAENRYFDAISTIRKGSCIVQLLDLATGTCRAYGEFGDVPEAGELPQGLSIRIESQTRR
ncbi:MAG: hypothetical protein ACI4R9_02265 [Kiritimatiellia bacterium]